jgi:hypothetical protein
MSGREQSPTNAPQATPFAEVLRRAADSIEGVPAEYERMGYSGVHARLPHVVAALRALAEREAELQRLIGEADGWVQGSGTPAELDEHGQELLTALAALPTALPAAPPAQEGE